MGQNPVKGPFRAWSASSSGRRGYGLNNDMRHCYDGVHAEGKGGSDDDVDIGTIAKPLPLSRSWQTPSKLGFYVAKVRLQLRPISETLQLKILSRIQIHSMLNHELVSLRLRGKLRL